MKRFFLRAMAVLYLLVLLAVAFVWIRSYWRADGIYHEHGETFEGASVHKGAVVWFKLSDSDVNATERWFYGVSDATSVATALSKLNPSRLASEWRGFGFAWLRACKEII